MIKLSRALAREDAFKLIFEMKTPGKDAMMAIDYLYSSVDKKNDMWAQEFISAPNRKYIKEIVSGVVEKEEEINDLIKAKLKNWTIERISKVNLSILQLAVYEILYLEDIPCKVSANEAVKLAKKYGTEESGSFINGVLGAIITDITEGNKKDDRG